ncbi:MAG: F0F1 ATP synthase subunit A [Bifidobacteriaceae bacterium]|nr:F0F1 ATP synthase subunit A [Bifidobacteriaceae bacterium]
MFVSAPALMPGAVQAESEGGFEAPSLADFFPPPFAFEGSNFFELNRLSLVRIIATVALVLVLWMGTKALRVVPGRGGNLFEMAVGFVHNSIAADVLGPQAARRYLPLLATIFFAVLGMNITGIIPLLNVASTSLVAMPLLLAIVSFVAFVWTGIHTHGAKGYFASALFPKGPPKFIYVILTPIEFLSTFILRPVTLTIRLMANMISGHFLLVAFFSMTNYLLIEATGIMKGVAVLSFGAALAFTAFEIFIAALQAYIFTLLTTVYISLARESH